MSDSPFTEPTQGELDQPDTGGGGLNLVHADSEHGNEPRMIADDQEPVSRFETGEGRL